MTITRVSVLIVANRLSTTGLLGNICHNKAYCCPVTMKISHI
jgi:hypothetical protein